MGKRVLATLLSVAMVLSLTIVPVGAASDENVPTVTLDTVSFTEADVTGFSEEGNKSDVNLNDTIAVKSVLTNTTSKTLYVSGFSQKLSYDSSALELYTFTYKPNPKKDKTVTEGPIITKEAVTDVPGSWIRATNTDVAGIVIWNATGDEKIEIESGETATLGYVLFKVKADTERGNYDIKFNLENDNNYVKSVENESDTQDSTIQGIDFSENNKATLSVVNGVPPTLQTVTLASDSVTVNGTKAQTVQAKATSAKGTDLTNSVTWSIGTPENGGGVSIAENGTITVAANAKAGAYTVYANKNSAGGGGGGSGSTNRPRSAETRSTVQGSAQATLTVTRAPSENKSIAISANKSKIEIPTGDTSETAIFEATFRDQYGDEKTADSVNWSITPSADGVSIDNRNGVVTVSKNAKNEISTSTEFTITAKSGNLTQDSKLTVKRAAAQAKSIELGTVNSMIVPADGADAKTATVTATVKDQYDTPISNPTVEWSISPADKGVSIDTTGKITVTNEAKEYIKDITGQQFTVTAKSDDVTKTATVTVKRAASTATSMKVFKGDVELTGNTDTIIIPSTNQDNTYTYSAKVYDQYGSEMTNAQPTLSFATADANVTYNDGKVTVSKDAVENTEYTLTASYGDLTSIQVKITTKAIEIKWPTATVAQSPVYGASWKDIVTDFTGGSATLNGETVTGQFTLKTPDAIPNAGSQTYVVNFKGALNGVTYDIDKTYDAVEIAKKSVTITGLSASDKEYNGSTTASVSGTATISGKLDKDNPTVTPGTASFADKNAGTNKTVTFIGYALSGDAAGNYELSGQPAPVKANITQKELTVTAGNLNFTKVYDGTTSVGTKSGNLELTNVISGDTVSVADGYTAAYADANVGTNKNVEVTGLTLTGTDAGNYKLKSTTLTVPDNSITKATWDKTTATSSAKYWNDWHA